MILVVESVPHATAAVQPVEGLLPSVFRHVKWRHECVSDRVAAASQLSGLFCRALFGDGPVREDRRLLIVLGCVSIRHVGRRTARDAIEQWISRAGKRVLAPAQSFAGGSGAWANGRPVSQEAHLGSLRFRDIHLIA